MATDLLTCRYTLADIDQAAQQFWQTLQGYKVFAFSGEMGAGKTTFIHKLCDHLAVEDTVSSPTFALINEYHFTDGSSADNTIYHMDWYRLRDSAEAINTGMDDCIEQARRGSKTYCFVEWPEKARELLNGTYIWISIETISSTERRLVAALHEA